MQNCDWDLLCVTLACADDTRFQGHKKGWWNLMQGNTAFAHKKDEIPRYVQGTFWKMVLINKLVGACPGEIEKISLMGMVGLFIETSHAQESFTRSQMFRMVTC